MLCSVVPVPVLVPVQVLLAEVRRLLLVRAKERFSRRILSWPYGGVTAEVRRAGEGWLRPKMVQTDMNRDLRLCTRYTDFVKGWAVNCVVGQIGQCNGGDQGT